MAKGFLGDSLVTTNRGLVPIKDIKPGDLVLTHAHHWKKVTKVNKEKVEGCMRLQTQGSPNTFAGREQEFHCMEKKFKYNKDTKLSERTFSNKKNKPIKKMNSNDFICIGKNTKKSSKLNKSQLWAFGKFISKGMIDEKTKEVTFFFNKDNTHFKRLLNSLPGTLSETKRFYKYVTSDSALYSLCHYFYKNNAIPVEVLELSDTLLKDFLKSICDEKAKKLEDEYFLIRDENRNLIYQIGQVVSNINPYGGFSLFCENSKYRIQFKDHVPKSSNFERIKNQLWQPVRDVEEWSAYRGYLYSLEVEDDNTYVVNGIVVKC